MEREMVLERREREALRIEGAPYPPVEHVPAADRQRRPGEPAVVVGSPEPVALRAPSRVAEAARADDQDPHGHPDPVIFHGYGPANTLTKTLTNAADMSGADTEPDVVMMSGNWFCDVSDDGGGSWKRLNPTTIFPNTFAGGFYPAPARITLSTRATAGPRRDCSPATAARSTPARGHRARTRLRRRRA